MAKIIVGMSGGVDSSVAALLLKRQGHEVIGLFMKNWEDDDTDDYCSARQDLEDAQAAAKVIGIPLEAANFADQYRERVFANFLTEYQAGRTPNPDILCNSEIKFKAFLDHAMRLGADKIATGHYAQVREFLGEWQLLKAEDGTKDQSYFLYRLNQAQLAKTLFPLGELYKRDVRKLAAEAGLPNHAKKDSTGICFIGERRFREFLSRYLPKQPGEIRRLDDERVIGQHEGLAYYTLGQREGLGIGGVQGAPEEPWFVAAKDMAKNVLYVVQGHDHLALLRDRLMAGQLSWISAQAPRTHWVYAAKTRYRMPDAACDLEALSANECDVAFAAPQWAVTPGQSVVFYESRVCMGGGVIL
ncbi:MAG: tRNA 2-thiouridine(34) synthase MnmA [Rhodocyclaceae bacterium]|nr:tRNA 2-thiouridine(34) synthase MnmA [Rhodocyclaceae bacterium]MDZ4213683.1 tRNA 2-thiouridine(34) synthase MnmA [Rhodocyclaceae bacterium]